MLLDLITAIVWTPAILLVIAGLVRLVGLHCHADRMAWRRSARRHIRCKWAAQGRWATYADHA